MKLSHQQALAVDALGHYLTHGGKEGFVLAGVAGSGKTTIIRRLTEMTDRPIWFVAPTAKAASVMMSKLPQGATVTTAHSFLYLPIEVTQSEVDRLRKEVTDLRRIAAADPKLRDQLRYAMWRLRQKERQLEEGMVDFVDKGRGAHPIVVADEASQLDEKLESDLRERAEQIVFVGDPAQLSPVNGVDFFYRNKPNVFLDEVHRQASDSTILRFATAMRKGEKFSDWDDTCRRIGGLGVDQLTQADVVITGMNATRKKLNWQMRTSLGRRGPLPKIGEPIMILRNDHGRKLWNGVVGVATTDARQGDPVRIGLAYEGRVVDVPIDPYEFEEYTLDKPTRDRRAVKSDYGYAITCHKSQGSEWENVVVWDDKMRAEHKDERRRWIYTAITRASQQLTWIQAVR